MDLVALKQIDAIKSVDDLWFKKCVGCVDFNTSLKSLSCCNHCAFNPYAICGSHDDFYSKELRKIN